MTRQYPSLWLSISRFYRQSCHSFFGPFFRQFPFFFPFKPPARGRVKPSSPCWYNDLLYLFPSFSPTWPLEPIKAGKDAPRDELISTELERDEGEEGRSEEKRNGRENDDMAKKKSNRIGGFTIKAGYTGSNKFLCSWQHRLLWPGWSGLVRFWICTKPDPPGLSSSIYLEVVMEQSWYIKLYEDSQNWYPTVMKLCSYVHNF